MPVQKITVTVTILTEADTLKDAVSAYEDLSLDDIANSIDTGDSVGQIAVEGIETVPMERIEEELAAIGNDGSFFGHLLDDEE